MAPELKRVIRLDSLPLNQTYFTDEGYLMDRPILTSIGIFEYANMDGSIRRELRVPEEVFSPESLKSYKGKPIIITHDAGLISRDNVHRNQIGTILTEGYRNGDDVRAEVVIHDTKAMRTSGLKELSLGYNLDLDETPGEWNGQHYDAVQRNIRINHLALVREARAGDQARLNIDSRDGTTLKGGKCMSKEKSTRSDGVLTPDELAKAIEEYKARRAKGDADVKKPNPFEKTEPAPAPVTDQPAQPVPAPAEENPFEKKDGENPFEKKPNPFQKKEEAPAVPGQAPAPEAAPAPNAGAAPAPAPAPAKEEKPNPFQKKEAVGDAGPVAPKNPNTPAAVGGAGSAEKAVEEVKERNANSEDIKLLCDIIDTLLAERAYDCAINGDCTPKTDGAGCAGCETQTDGNEPAPTKGGDDDDDREYVEGEEGEEFIYADSDNEQAPAKTLNTDSAEDRSVWLKLGMAARDLNLDGLEDMSRIDAMKAVVNAATPALRLDGKSDVYVAAAFERAVIDAKARGRHDVSEQYRQAFNRDGRQAEEENTSASARRKLMIERNLNRNK